MSNEETMARAVKMKRENVVIPTYSPCAPDKNPIFHEKRSYQGASGRIYPLPVTDRLSHEKADREYDSFTLENEFIRIMVLPEIGGRIHVGLDKTNNYNFIYHNTVIKPALIGIAGSWISGGIEFNWPQHHRPTTFMPVETAMDENADGSKTVWVGETEPIYGLKSLAGITVYPGRSYLEVKVRVSNPTPFPQPFMWWANLGVHCDENYRIVFPQDVKHLAFHDRAFVSEWPMTQDRLSDQPDARFDGSWFKNHMNAGSFMVMDGTSEYDFIGGYDMARNAGTVHVADHHVAPGKKLFTWGNGEFARAWRDNLTDVDGSYLELMTGAYTDNQPDFSWLQPNETRTFEHVWYPVRDIGLVKNASRDAAVSMELTRDNIAVGFYATGRFVDSVVSIKAGNRLIYERRLEIDPAHPCLVSMKRPENIEDTQIEAAIRSLDGRTLAFFRPEKSVNDGIPPPRTPSPEPSDLKLSEDLYIHGLHIEQYRHHSFEASDYYREALRRDPGDIRCNNAMGLLEMRKGLFDNAERYFKKSLERLTSRNTNPYDGEPMYNLGIAQKFLGKDEEAYRSLYKAAWNYAWKLSAYLALAELDCRRSDFDSVLKHIGESLLTNAGSLRGKNLMSAALRHMGRASEAVVIAEKCISMDMLDYWAQFELYFALKQLGLTEKAGSTLERLISTILGKAEAYLGVAFDYIGAGIINDALQVLDVYFSISPEGMVYPMAYYTAAYLHNLLKEPNKALDYCRKAEKENPDYCFPNRLEYIAVLQNALQVNPAGPKAWYYLGNLFYDKKRFTEAIECWEKSRDLDSLFSVVHRNLALGYFDKRHDAGKAIESMQKACEANTGDSRLLYELLQLLKNANAATVEERLNLLKGKNALVAERDDCYVEMLILLLQAGRLEEAGNKIMDHVYDIYEGGEGKLIRVFEWSQILRGLKMLDSDDALAGRNCIQNALTLPEYFHEGRNLSTGTNHVHYWAGMAAKAAGNFEEEIRCFQNAAAYVVRPGEASFYRALALKKLGDEGRAVNLLQALFKEGEMLIEKGGRYDYFATGVPTPPPFEGDREKHNACEGLYLKALAHIGMGMSIEGQKELEAVLTHNSSHLGAWIHAGYTGVRLLF